MWLTVDEVAKRFKRSARQVRAAIERGYLRANRPEGTKAYRILESDAEARYGVAALHGRSATFERESPSARERRQLAEAGLR